MRFKVLRLVIFSNYYFENASKTFQFTWRRLIKLKSTSCNNRPFILTLQFIKPDIETTKISLQWSPLAATEQRARVFQASKHNNSCICGIPESTPHQKREPPGKIRQIKCMLILSWVGSNKKNCMKKTFKWAIRARKFHMTWLSCVYETDLTIF